MTIKKLTISFLICLTMLISNFSFVNGFIVRASEPNNNTQEFEIEQVTFNNAEHYLNIEHSSDFTIFNNYVILLKNNQLFAYNLETRALTENFLQLNNVSFIYSTEYYLFILTNNIIKIYNETLSEVTILNGNNPQQIFANMFAVIESTSAVTIATMQNNMLNIVKTDMSLNIISHNSTSLLTVNEVLDLTLSDDFIYIIHKLSSANVMLEIAVNSLQTQKTFVTEILDTTKITFSNLYDKNLIFSISDNKKKLSLFEVNSQNSELTLNQLLEKKNSIFTNPTFKLGQISEISAIKVINNQIFILDKTNKSLQTFEIVFNNETNTFNLKENNVLLASSGYDLGRFNNPQKISAVNKTNFVVTDTFNNRLQLINNNVVTEISSYKNNGTTTELHQPQSTLLTNNLQLVVYNKALTGDEVLVLTKDGQFLSSIKTYLHNETEKNINNLTSLAINKQNILWAIDTTNNVILKSENFAPFKIFDNQFTNENTLNLNSKIITTTNNQLVVYNNNELHLINAQTGNILHSVNLDTAAKDIFIDANNNIFILTNLNIVKFNIVNNQIIFNSKANLTNINLNNITHLTLSNDSGEIYLFNNFTQQLIKVTNTSFSNGLTEFTHPVNINQPTALTNLISLGMLNNDAYIFTYPNYEGESFKQLQGQSIFILKHMQEEGFYVVLFKYNNKLKQGYIKTNYITLTPITENAETKTLTTINKKVKIFKYPVLLPTQDNQSIFLSEVTLNTTLTALTERIESIDGSYYYAVSLDNGSIGYVNSADAIYLTTTQPNTLVKPNFKVFSLNGEVKVYSNDTTNSNVIETLTNFTAVYIESYNKNLEFTKIIYLDENYNEKEGHILTHNVWKESNEQQITAFVLTLVGVLLLSLTTFTFVKIRKKKKDI